MSLSPAQIKHRLDKGGSSSSYPQRNNLNGGRETMDIDPRSGRPAEAVKPVIDLVDIKLLKDRHLKTKEIAAKLTLSKTTENQNY